MEAITHALATGNEVSMLKRELLWVRKVAAPAWKACERFSKQMAKCRYQPDERKVRAWKFILDDTRVVYWSYLSQRLRHRWRGSPGFEWERYETEISIRSADASTKKSSAISEFDCKFVGSMTPDLHDDFSAKQFSQSLCFIFQLIAYRGSD